uniref:Putative ovule protein n=1 Tax=Solanum chacoense TaxID=4108 RepID=A0A0V0GXM9_SOLCH
MTGFCCSIVDDLSGAHGVAGSRDTRICCRQVYILRFFFMTSILAIASLSSQFNKRKTLHSRKPITS